MMTIDKPAWATESDVDQNWLAHTLTIGAVTAVRRDELTTEGLVPGDIGVYVAMPDEYEPLSIAQAEQLHQDLTAVLYKVTGR
jgi:hypothetical protein